VKLSAITVCVNYSEFLGQSLARWKAGTDELIVVTHPGDIATKALCSGFGVRCHPTARFYQSGAAFNKAGALNQAISETGILDRADWFAFVDADVVPPADWREQLEDADLRGGNLYGARRFAEDGRLIPDGELAGYFQLFSAADPAAQGRPLLIEFSHAGCYDSVFMARWPLARRIFLPLDLVHLGDCGRNWCGRGNDQAMGAMLHERRRRGGWQHERLQT
jgi:glycosyltransferase involved in cell wall biosynthesis